MGRAGGRNDDRTSHDDRSVEREVIQFPSLTLAGLARRVPLPVSTGSPEQRRFSPDPPLPHFQRGAFPAETAVELSGKERTGGAGEGSYRWGLHGLRVATGKRGWRALWLQSSANFRRCSMFVGGWPTCRRGLHGLDDPSWDRLPSGLIGKALGCGRVWTLQQCGRCARLQGKCRARELQ